MPASSSDPDSDAPTGYLVTTWRTVQKLDADGWRKLRDDAPLRATRWALTLGVISVSWVFIGTAKDANVWLPVLAIVALLLLPDASSIGFGGFTWQARQAADQAIQASETARETVGKLELTLRVAAATGEVAVESAQARSAPAQSADEALGEFLI